MSDKPSPAKPATPPRMNPGDEAPSGSPGTGETVCPRCGVSGRIERGARPYREGTGKVVRGIGGA